MLPVVAGSRNPGDDAVQKIGMITSFSDAINKKAADACISLILYMNFH
jgi:hypothetical protein